MPGPDPRAAVRVAAFERSMDAFNDEQGRKVALSIAVALAAYHEEYGKPVAAEVERLEARIAVLETPAWRRLCNRLRRRAT